MIWQPVVLGSRKANIMVRRTGHPKGVGTEYTLPLMARLEGRSRFTRSKIKLATCQSVKPRLPPGERIGRSPAPRSPEDCPHLLSYYLGQETPTGGAQMRSAPRAPYAAVAMSG